MITIAITQMNLYFCLFIFCRPAISSFFITNCLEFLFILISIYLPLITFLFQLYMLSTSYIDIQNYLSKHITFDCVASFIY